MHTVHAELTHGQHHSSTAGGTLFFAPDRLATRARQWGAVELDDAPQ